MSYQNNSFLSEKASETAVEYSARHPGVQSAERVIKQVYISVRVTGPSQGGPSPLPARKSDSSFTDVSVNSHWQAFDIPGQLTNIQDYFKPSLVERRSKENVIEQRIREKEGLLLHIGDFT